MLILGMVQSGNNILTQIPLYHVCFWVQVHDLPVGFMLPVVGEHLGNFIGEFVEYDTNNNVGIWKPFMRIKVRVHVRNPLKKERKVRKAGGEWNVVKFKYERLGIFCYLCGVLLWGILINIVRSSIPWKAMMGHGIGHRRLGPTCGAAGAAPVARGRSLVVVATQNRLAVTLLPSKGQLRAHI